MKQFPAFLLIVLLSAATISCKKSGSGSKIPHIDLIGMEPDHVKISQHTDTIFLFFDITDGDADLGVANQNDIFMLDSRAADTLNNNTDTLKFQLPEIPSGAVNPDKGLEGQFVVPLWWGLLHTRTDSTARDTLTYEIYVVDKAGHQSNHVTTPKIYLEQ